MPAPFSVLCVCWEWKGKSAWGWVFGTGARLLLAQGQPYGGSSRLWSPSCSSLPASPERWCCHFPWQQAMPQRLSGSILPSSRRIALQTPADTLSLYFLTIQHLPQCSPHQQLTHIFHELQAKGLLQVGTKYKLLFVTFHLKCLCCKIKSWWSLL